MSALGFILLCIAVALSGVLMRPLGWVVFALALVALVLYIYATPALRP